MSSPHHEATGAAAPFDELSDVRSVDRSDDRSVEIDASGEGVDGDRASDAAARAGQLTPGWQIVVTLAWVTTIVAQAAVWSASRQLGLSTWWLGPTSQPRPVWIALAPFVPATTVAVLALTGRRFVPWVGLVAAACIGAVGLGDLGRVTGLGVVELMIAGAAALVSIAAFAGTYRTALPGED